MTVTKIRLDGTAIRDEVSFHRVCQVAFGFPSYYGANWNAWIDCMSCIDDPSGGLSTVHVPAGETLEIELTDTKALWKRCPELLQSLTECTAFVNERFVSLDLATRVTLTFLEVDRGRQGHWS